MRPRLVMVDAREAAVVRVPQRVVPHLLRHSATEVPESVLQGLALDLPLVICVANIDDARSRSRIKLLLDAFDGRCAEV
jgi:hypothetical protein